MSLFQKSVEQKYLNELDQELIDQKYLAFQDYFGNPAIQENIRNSKEEQFQEGFLRELFVSILGYTLFPQPDFNLTTELKNIANSKKADGAILKGADAVAVIELKGTDTTDLDKIEAQAFGYKNHNPKCVYVITSNFEKLRFYIQYAVEHLDFDLFRLSREQFALMWLCLSKENLLNGVPLKIKESSLFQEENITKKLYADYSRFRTAMYNNLTKKNPETDKLLLFKKTQKLLDRFLFILFAEDRLLLPPNSISEIVKQWIALKEDMDVYVPLYDRFKKYFGYMNTGYIGKKYEIYAYNGGLFAPDELLDSISIDDEILYEHTLALSNYNYETEVDVNTLGHIFEHSLGEIESVQAEIKGEKIDHQKTKRKKDGIFYTPKYITKYIVEHTVGKLCEEKRTELGIIDEEYAKGRKNRKKETLSALDKKLEAYRQWLLSLTILDPACGSGAFLNQALDFLITEHQKIDELRAQLLESSLFFSYITTDILEKNIYGVDINEESVEIAKLSLWLRTAQKGRKLNTLSNNIKCGNSLIDDPEIAGEKAFNWQNEFPEIFANGGFDVVIGNPPYIQLQKEGGKLAQAFEHQGFSTFE
ncbi:MAG TPA: restriction endonuclease subunit M, partial [Saprospirales bacterium]|nr:restriction endonuclease subunit M [Saprospirales bacterium]